MLLDLIFILTMGEPEVAHKASAPAINKPLNLFTVPSTDVTLKKGRFAVHNPIQWVLTRLNSLSVLTRSTMSLLRVILPLRVKLMRMTETLLGSYSSLSSSVSISYDDQATHSVA